jgi:hypothetical protein
MNKFRLTVFALCCFTGLSSNTIGQDIDFNLTFTGDTVQYPFENIETISELTMDGNVESFSDTSLVRSN